MYDKNQIIKEIKRVAKVLGEKSLDRSDFISRTMIPEKTVDFYIVSWQDALVEAGLEPHGKKLNDISDNKLLEDLIRLYNQYGEIPTMSLIHDSGKYPGEKYKERWRTLEDAMNVAKRKFPEYIKENEVNHIYEDKSAASDSSIFNLDDTMVSINREDLILKKSDNKEIKHKEEKDEDYDFNFRTDNVGIENLLSELPKKNKKKKRKIIPKTIKPDKKNILKDDIIDFRGLKTIPDKKEELIFLFGMVCEELNYNIISFSKKSGCFSGKRLSGEKKSAWENINISFFVNSSDCKDYLSSDHSCDLVVCWNHDWIKCPVEILELKSTIELLENYSPFEK